METTFETEKNKSIDLLCNMRAVNALLDVRKQIEEERICINCLGDEYDYIASQAAVKTEECILNIINNKISELSKTKE